MGDCHAKKAGIYLILFASLLMMAAALFPDTKLPEDRKKIMSLAKCRYHCGCRLVLKPDRILLHSIIQ
jgi:hypothetical protein